MMSYPVTNRPLSHGGHFESQENKKLCFCTSGLALDERLAVRNHLFQHCMMKVYTSSSCDVESLQSAVEGERSFNSIVQRYRVGSWKKET